MSIVEDKIGNVCIVGDGAHASIKRCSEGIQYLSSKNFKKEGLDLNKVDLISENDFLKYFKEDSKALTKPKCNDVLLSIIGSLGAPYLVREHDVFGLSSSVSILRPHAELLSPNYLCYWIKSPDFQNAITNTKSGVAQSFLSLGMIKDLPIKYPLFPIQKRIADILSTYDNLIENNLQRIKHLEAMATCEYKMMMKESEEIEIKSIAKVIGGYAFKSNHWQQEGFKVIKIKNIGNNSVEIENCDCVSQSVIDNALKFELFENNLLIAMTGATVGKVGLMPKNNSRIFLNQRVGLFKSLLQFDVTSILFCAFNEDAVQQQIMNLAGGAAQPNISGGQIESIKILIPKDINLLQEFCQNTSKTFSLIVNIKSQNTHLRQIRDTLLPKLMRGQINL